MKTIPTSFRFATMCTLILMINQVDAQEWNWVQSHKSPNVNGSYFQSITSDHNGSIYCGGVLQDTVYFNTDTLPGDYWWDLNGYGDMVLAKYDDNTGEELWVKRYGGKGFSLLNDLKCDEQGNLYAVAHFLDSLYLDNDTLIADGFSDGVILKFDPDGNVLWHRQMTGPAIEYPNAIAIAASGTIIVAGYYTDIAMWDGTFFTHNGNGNRLMTVGFDPEGNLKWHNTYQGAQFVYITSIESKDESLWISGSYEGNLNLGPYNSSSNGFWDPYVAKLDTLGDVAWLNAPGDNSHDGAGGIVVDEQGFAYVCGSFSESIDWGGTAPILYASSIYQDGFIVKLDKEGKGVWANRYSGTHLHQDFLVDLDIDSRGGLYASGFCRGGIIVGDSIVEAPVGVGPTFLVLMTNTLGEDQWAKGVGFGQGKSIIYKNEAVFVNGWTDGYTDFGNGIEFGPDNLFRPTVARISLERLPTSVEIITEDYSKAVQLLENPTAGSVRIKLAQVMADMTAEVYDISGKMVYQAEFGTTDLVSFDLAVPAGSYIIILKQDDRVIGNLKWICE